MHRTAQGPCGCREIFGLALILMVPGCVVPTEPQEEMQTSRVSSVRIDVPTYRLAVGDVLTLRATPRDARGVPVQGASVYWRSLDPGVALVDHDGRVVGVSPGNVVVTAEAAGATGSVLLAVAPPPQPRFSLTLSPSTQTLWLGWSGDVVVTVSGGPHGTPASWSCISSNPAVLAVSNTQAGCAMTGIRLGTALVRVVAGRGGEFATASVPVTITPAG